MYFAGDLKVQDNFQTGPPTQVFSYTTDSLFPLNTSLCLWYFFTNAVCSFSVQHQSHSYTLPPFCLLNHLKRCQVEVGGQLPLLGSQKNVSPIHMPLGVAPEDCRQGSFCRCGFGIFLPQGWQILSRQISKS